MTNDVVLMTYLATITKGLATTSEVYSHMALNVVLAAEPFMVLSPLIYTVISGGQ